jgi:hypothetical protein
MDGFRKNRISVNHSLNEDEDSEISSIVSTSTLESKKRKCVQSSLAHFGQFSQEKQTRLHILLLKAMVTSAIPFKFLENIWFRKYQEELSNNRMTKLPSRYSFSENLLQQLHQDLLQEQIDGLQEHEYYHLSLDGWMDNSQTSYYALMIVKR